MRKLSAVAATAAVVASIVFGGTQASGEQLADPLSPPCDQTGMTQRFLDWGDERYYVPAPGGELDGEAPGWDLGDGASFARRGNPDGTREGGLVLKPGATVTTPPICVFVDYTVSRMFAMQQRGDNNSALKIEVIHDDPINCQEPNTETTVLPATNDLGDWGPTGHWTMPIVHQAVNLNEPTEPVEVQFKITAMEGRWVIDDLWVDPRMRR